MAGPARIVARILENVLLAALVIAGVANVALDEELGGGESADLVPPWLLGRLVAHGYGPDAYDPAIQFRELRSMVDWSGPPANDTPEHRRTRLPPHRLDLLDSPQIRANALCPYPPTAAILYAPLGRLWFADAADALRYVNLGLAVLCVGLLYRAVEGRVGLLVCAAMVLYYPASYYTLQLGQNGFLTLALLAGGWAELVRGRDVLAGLIWGLLAYKIHWLGAIGWVPLAMGRPKVFVGMAASAGLFVAASVAVVGVAGWSRWFVQGQAFDRVYAFDLMFRDTLLGQGCDLRCMAFRLGPDLPALLVRPLAWAFIAGVILVTAWCHRRRPNATALLFGACLASPHLYFYDQVVFLLPLTHLWGRAADLRVWQFVAAYLLSLAYYVSLIVMQYYEWEGPPTATLVVLGLWLLSLTVRGRA